MNVENRTIFENDNLYVMRGMDSESVDLIYLDPPFNSNRNYAAPIGDDRYENLQLLCNFCNSTKGTGTQQDLVVKLKEMEII